MIGKPNALSLPSGSSQREEDPGSESRKPHGGNLPWFRGLLLCRRCDFCGTRISVHDEGDDSVIMKCPQCQREYVFFQRPD